MRHILACHDGSPEATRAVEKFLRSGEEPADVTVFHVVEPVPPALLEHRGSEDPEEEEKLQKHLRERRRDWIRGHLAEANQAFRPILKCLRSTGGHDNQVSLKLLPAEDGEDFFAFLREEAVSGDYDQVVVATRPESWLRNLLARSTADRVKRDLEGVDVEVVEVSA